MMLFDLSKWVALILSKHESLAVWLFHSMGGLLELARTHYEGVVLDPTALLTAGPTKFKII